MSVSVDEFIVAGKEIVEKKIKQFVEKEAVPASLYDSMTYSLRAGGKRLRPVLLFTSYDAFAENKEKTYRTAIALEMIHTYSLIHDDLPAMDDDDYRRGKLTNHKKFDEATAILAGDALLTHSFELITKDDLLTADEKVFIVDLLAHAAGPAGMVGGQVLDMEGESKKLSLSQLEEIHQLKTGKLISFAIVTGAYLAGVNEEQQQHLQDFAYYLGLIFQVQDDILDVIGDAEKLGKPVGSDVDNEKSTYPNLLGLDGAIKQKELYIEKAETALRKAEPKSTELRDLLHYFSERDH